MKIREKCFFQKLSQILTVSVYLLLTVVLLTLLQTREKLDFAEKSFETVNNLENGEFTNFEILHKKVEKSCYVSTDDLSQVRPF